MYQPFDEWAGKEIQSMEGQDKEYGRKAEVSIQSRKTIGLHIRSNSLDGRVSTNLAKIEEEEGLTTGTLDGNYGKKKRAQRSASENKGVGDDNDQDS